MMHTFVSRKGSVCTVCVDVVGVNPRVRQFHDAHFATFLNAEPQKQALSLCVKIRP